MTMKKVIQQEINNFLTEIATAYGELIRNDIPDAQFTTTVETVQTARDEVIDRLVLAARVMVERTVQDTINSMPEVKTKKILPPDVHMTEALVHQSVAAPLPVSEDVKGGAKLLSTAPLPREVGDKEDPFLSKGAMHVPQVASTRGIVRDEWLDPFEPPDHEAPLRTIAEENRVEQGLPRRVYRPHIHLDGKSVTEMPPERAPKKGKPNG